MKAGAAGEGTIGWEGRASKVMVEVSAHRSSVQGGTVAPPLEENGKPGLNATL